MPIPFHRCHCGDYIGLYDHIHRASASWGRPVLALVSYAAVGVVIPLLNGKKGKDSGQKYRDSFGELNTAVLDNLYGLEESCRSMDRPRSAWRRWRSSRRTGKDQ